MEICLCFFSRLLKEIQVYIYYIYVLYCYIYIYMFYIVIYIIYCSYLCHMISPTDCLGGLLELHPCHYANTFSILIPFNEYLDIRSILVVRTLMLRKQRPRLPPAGRAHE